MTKKHPGRNGPALNTPALGRRQLLRTGAVALGGVGTGWAGAAVALETDRTRTSDTTSGADTTVEASSPAPGNRTVAFHGPRQAGVTTTPQANLSLLGLDLEDGTDRDGLERLLRLVSDDAARLSRGLPALADSEPELAERPASLSVTVGLGPRVLRDLLPAYDGLVAPIPALDIDRLDDAWGQTDVALQICTDDPVMLAHTRRMLLKDLAGIARLRWVQEGFRRATGVEAEGTTMRNLMGQVDGTGNPLPTDADFDGLLWSEREGFVGGTCMAVRRIRMELDTWDKVDRAGRETTIGRRLDNGAPLTGTKEFDSPDFQATDAQGLPVIDPASHIARATSQTPRERFLRRGYNYVVPDADRPTGEDSGLIFIAFAADLEEQFVPVQRRLATLDRLNEWTTPIGSAVYAVPPGAAEGEYVGQGMIETQRAKGSA